MRFPRTLGIIDQKKTDELIMRSIAMGVNYFDTAFVYPGSEETLGTILDKNQARSKVYIATKLPLIMLKTPADFDKYFVQHLERLKTNYIDYYLLHMITDMVQWTKLKSWGIEDWIARKKKTGEIKYIGFSFHGAQNEFLRVIDDYDWELSQIQYNYSDENFQAGVTGLRAAALKMPVVAMEPLLGGKLATGLPKEAVNVFQKANAELSPAGWALNWLWNQEEVAVVLSGMSSMEQLEENALLADRAKAGMSGEVEKAAYAEALELVKHSCKIRCTGCNYCMPCPRGVNIPGCFSAYNASYSMGYAVGMHQFFSSVGLTSENGSSPSQCVNCGKCETHCPQKIPIMKELGKVRRRMEPFWIRFIGVCARFFLGKKRQSAKEES
jgi:predicted aldo/keto reductase-like oxidoreductase